MKKLWIIILLIPFLTLFSCTEDASTYLPQDKEIVGMDSVKNEQGENEGDNEILPEGKLVPGIHLVKLNVTTPDGTTEERRFKYFMPISIEMSKPISLIFEFHGSYTFDAGVKPSDPLAGISTGHTLIQHAIKENCVVCFPAGSPEYQEDSSGAVNWQNSERHLPFVDLMIDYFKGRTPSVDMNRIYSTGQSSGAIFSFVLAYYRSDVFAAITPRAGQMKIDDSAPLPQRAVPVRVFAGTADETVVHSAVIANMTTWAEKIGGYFASDMVLKEDSIEIENYKKVDTRIWSGGKADLQIYSLKEEGHGISIAYCMPYMWEFMKNHTLDAEATQCFVTASVKKIEADENQPFSFSINYNDGAAISINGPADWNVQLANKTVTLKAPQDYYTSTRKGNIQITATKDGDSYTLLVPFTLKAPKYEFTIGDIYYNDNFEPVGVVCWVNDANVKEAKILNLQEVTTQGKNETINFGNFGATFATPDLNDGENNTALHVKENTDKGLQLTATNSGLIWAATYSYEGVSGWYLPAINELAAIDQNLDEINDAMKKIGGRELKPATAAAGGYLSSTVILKNGQKAFQYFNFYNHTQLEQSGTNTSYFRARAIKKVSK